MTDSDARRRVIEAEARKSIAEESLRARAETGADRRFARPARGPYNLRVRRKWTHQEADLTSRLRLSLAGLAVGLITILAPFAQQKLNLPVQQEPGQPKKMVLPEAPPAPEGTAVTVAPAPEPWYTVFGTGEVVGYIEPCG